MSDTTSANIKLIAPELTAFIDANPSAVSLVLADAVLMVSDTIYGKFEERAQRYLAAHLLTLISNASSGSGGSAAGAVSRERVGEVEIEYAVSGGSCGSVYSSTSYGRTFMDIKRGAVPSFTVMTP